MSKRRPKRYNGC